MRLCHVMVAVALSGCALDTQPLGSSQVLDPIGECLPGQAIRAIGSDGTVACEQVAGFESGNLIVAPQGEATDAQNFGSYDLVLRSSVFNGVRAERFDFLLRNDAEDLVLGTDSESGTFVEQVRVASDGYVGIGTTVPDSRLHLAGTDARGYAATLRLQNLNAGGANAFITATDDNWAAGPNKLLLGLGAMTNSNDAKIVIDSNGNVGIGTIAPLRRLTVQSSADGSIPMSILNSGGDEAILLEVTGAGYGRMNLCRPGFACTVSINSDVDSYFMGGSVGIGTTDPAATLVVGNQVLRFVDGVDDLVVKDGVDAANVTATVLQAVDTASDGGLLRLQDVDATCLADPEAADVVWNCSSDERLKRDIHDAASVLPSLMKLRIRDYTVIASGNRLTGVVAQEVLQTHAELVTRDADGHLMVREFGNWKLVKAIQEQQGEIESLRADLAMQREVNRRLETRLSALEDRGTPTGSVHDADLGSATASTRRSGGGFGPRDALLAVGFLLAALLVHSRYGRRHPLAGGAR